MKFDFDTLLEILKALKPKPRLVPVLIPIPKGPSKG